MRNFGFWIADFGSGRRLRLAALVLALPFAGCIGAPANPGARTPTAVEPERAEPGYWLRQPAAVSVAYDDFQELWTAARNAAQGASFTIDRVDYRGGVMTTFPIASKQFFEFWRHDVAAPDDLTESSLATVRRTVRFEFAQLDDGTYELVPKVLVERWTSTERRITSVYQYREVFSIERAEGSRLRDDLGYDLPTEYWYAIGRDADLERALARSVQNQLRARMARR